MIRFILLFVNIFLVACGSVKSPDYFTAEHPHIQYEGRVWVDSASGKSFLSWSATGFRIRFEGENISLRMYISDSEHEHEGNSCWLRIQLDDLEPKILEITPGDSMIPIASGLSAGSHQLHVFKRTEANTGTLVLEQILLSPDGKLLPPEARSDLKLEFYGNSITCGYGNEGGSKDCHFSPDTEDAWMSYAGITARELQANYRTICFSGRGIYQNYDKSTTGTIPLIYDRYAPDWDSFHHDFSEWQADVVLINLGTNDFAHANPDSADFVNAYLDFLKNLKGQYPEAKIVMLTGSMMSNSPPSRRPLATLQLWQQAIMDELGWPDLYRFDMSTQGALGYGCDWHPNVAQHEKNAGELVSFLKMEVL